MEIPFKCLHCNAESRKLPLLFEVFVREFTIKGKARKETKNRVTINRAVLVVLSVKIWMTPKPSRAETDKGTTVQLYDSGRCDESTRDRKEKHGNKI